ncbi:MAG TPA: hypothetical protein VFZ91_03425 [Allosphingosinicella sp.]
MTYFAVGAQQLPFQTGIPGVITPSFNGFRTEFPNGMKAGQATGIPPMLASASFDMDLDSGVQPKLVGCIAVLMEEDETPDSSIVLGLIAYSKEIETQLNALVKKRILDGDTSPLRDAEITALREAVAAKVTAAIGSNQQTISALFRNQDDPIGSTFRTFTHSADDAGRSEIKFQFFDFPEISKGRDRFLLSGRLSLGPVLPDPVDRCATPRAALKAQQQEVASLQRQIMSLQQQLQQAGPGAKAGIVASIRATAERLTQAEARLPALQAALDACLTPFNEGLLDSVAGSTGLLNKKFE